MIFSWIDIAAGAVVNLGWMWAGSRYGFCWSRVGRKKKEEDDGRLPYNASWKKSELKSSVLDTYAYRCPKCHTDRINSSADASLKFEQYNPKYCECAEHEKAHFHFECVACGFKCLTKTAGEK
jgi:hypothetical protein